MAGYCFRRGCALRRLNRSLPYRRKQEHLFPVIHMALALNARDFRTAHVDPAQEHRPMAETGLSVFLILAGVGFGYWMTERDFRKKRGNWNYYRRTDVMSEWRDV